MWRCTQAREASWRALLEPVLALSAKVCFFALATFRSLPVQTVSGCVRRHEGLASQSIRQTATSYHPYSIFCAYTLACAYWSAATLLFLDLTLSKCSYCLIAIVNHTYQPADSPTVVACSRKAHIVPLAAARFLSGFISSAALADLLVDVQMRSMLWCGCLLENSGRYLAIAWLQFALCQTLSTKT